MGETEDGSVDHISTDAHQKCTLVCEPHGTTNDKDNGPLMNAVFKNPVCKVYRFQTTDSKWMLVREQMAECTLSFSIPIQLLRLFIQEDRHRIQELNNLAPPAKKLIGAIDRQPDSSGMLADESGPLCVVLPHD
ncbi:Type II inositol 3,4-bisphosphate 4-phosphatase [Bagarius yarrelli]|uniref:Type II inositol 3,4-bisphosphate 4-phosphatase n=1 Tax=Bagarius yarrelli TaxID=175774 RepID=A0A556TMA3_BAGYA|nr:Type II inositol 3,4-bisphosphate 4-phosphatase [Bagarius yarrelli]